MRDMELSVGARDTPYLLVLSVEKSYTRLLRLQNKPKMAEGLTEGGGLNGAEGVTVGAQNHPTAPWRRCPGLFCLSSILVQFGTKAALQHLF